MNPRRVIICIVCSSLYLVGCNSKKETAEAERRIALDYPTFENLTAIADCIGPKYNYVTIVHSTVDGYTFFRQEHDGRENFTAVIANGKTGFQLSDSLQRLDSLSVIAVEIIKGHEFHKIHVMPDRFFDQLSYVKNETYQGQDCELYGGADQFNNPVQLYYQRAKKRLVGLLTLNPMDTTERIEVIYKEWMQMQFGPMAKQVEIIQGGKDVYQFNFSEVQVNQSDFERISIQ